MSLRCFHSISKVGVKRTMNAGHVGRIGFVGLFVVFLVGCQASERATVQFSYVVEPERGLPPGMTTLAIQPAKVGDNTDPKWSDLCATVLQSLVNESRIRYGTNVQVTDRRDTQVTFDEADMAAAGMTTAKTRTGGQLLAAQATILSNINVKVDKTIGRQRTLSGLDLAGFDGHGYSGGGGRIETDEVETVTRTLTVQTDFRLVDTANNRIWAQHTPRPYTSTDRTHASPIFGSSQTEAELTPRDQIIAALVDQAAREFISQLMPCRIDVSEEVISSGDQNCMQGVRMLRAEAFGQAVSYFEAALASHPDDHRASFGAGVACEASGDSARALRFYRSACASRNSDVYRAARDRMKMYGSRIRR